MLDFINSTEKSDTVAIVTRYIYPTETLRTKLAAAMSTSNPVRMAYVRVLFRPFKTLIPSARKLMMPRHLPSPTEALMTMSQACVVERIVVNSDDSGFTHMSLTTGS
jgi:hypothetical protein